MKLGQDPMVWSVIGVCVLFVAALAVLSEVF